MSQIAETAFDELRQHLSSEGVERALEKLADQLRQEKRYQELFDALLMQHRFRLGLPVAHPAGLDDLEPPLRDKLESAYLEACREVGSLLMEAGRVREAWVYLRPLAENQMAAEKLRGVPIDEENIEEVIEVALHEGVDPRYGFELILDHYGTCNAITLYDQEMPLKPVPAQRSVASLLVRHLHAELLENVKADIAQREGSEPEADSLTELVADRDWLFADDNYHIDTSHLSSVVRFSLVLEDEEDLRTALDLTEYGRRLSPQFQFGGEEPFSDAYVHHGLFLKALLGEAADEALAHFGERARNLPADENGTAAAEVYVALLARLGRYDEAMDAYAELIPPGTRTIGFAPHLMELARLGGNYEHLIELCRQRGDLLGYAAGLVQQQGAAE